MKEKNPALGILIPVGISLLAALIAGVILVFAFTAIAYATGDPDSLITPLSLTALALSTMVCGIVSAKLCDSEILSPVLSAVISGVVFAIMLFLLSVIPVRSGAEYGTGLKAILYCAIVGVSTLGGVIGKPRGRRRPKYPRKMKRR